LYLRPKKQQRAVIWTVYSRRQRRVVAHHIGDKGVESAITAYRLALQAVGEIGAIFTDANSCYALAFKRNGVTVPHLETKAQTHLIESSNSSIRDNLARFNRRTKRVSKTMQMLEITLNLFFNRHLIRSPK
ncbi:IS1 family transposase, partial [Devosia sp. MC532]|uniref:IS1 family transposase n=1 Tax=Devosia sp. MC532 TaxID=2799788 RepID=UPI0018F6D098